MSCWHKGFGADWGSGLGHCIYVLSARCGPHMIPPAVSRFSKIHVRKTADMPQLWLSARLASVSGFSCGLERHTVRWLSVISRSIMS